MGVHHNICGQVMWSRVPSRAVPLSITYFHLSKGLQFSAGMDNQLRIGVAGLRSLRLPNRRRRRINRWSSYGRARGAWHQAPPSCPRPLAVMVGIRSPLCWSRDSKALSVFHPCNPSLADLARSLLALAEFFWVSGSTSLYSLHKRDSLHNMTSQTRL